MKTCKVILTVSRAGAGFSQAPGDEVEVSLAEAGRLLARGDCERPDAKTLKAIAAQAAAEVETAAAAEAEVETAAAPAAEV